VLGVSKDTPASHTNFKEKYALPFTLLADTKKSIIQSYGASRGVLTARITYIIDPGDAASPHARSLFRKKHTSHKRLSMGILVN